MTTTNHHSPSHLREIDKLRRQRERLTMNQDGDADSLTLTLLSTVLVGVGGAGLLQNPMVRKGCQATLGDPQVQDILYKRGTRLFQMAVAAVLRRAGVEARTPRAD